MVYLRILVVILMAGLVAFQALATQKIPPRPDQPVDGLQVDLSAHFNNDGIATSVDPTDGNVDGSGYSYPGEHLPPPGITKIGGITFRIPGRRPQEKNNIIAEGQQIDLPSGKFHAASLLVASTYGASSGQLIFHYDDGTTTSALFHVADWYSSPGGIVAMPFRYTPGGGKEERPVFLSGVRLGLDGKRTLLGVTLPPAPEGPKRLHIFALTLHSLVNGIHIEFFDLDGGPKITTEEPGRHVVRLKIQNLGTRWVSASHAVRIVVVAPGVTTVAPARVENLAPGEVLEAHIGLVSGLQRGTEVRGQATVTSGSGIKAYLPLTLMLGASDYTAVPGSLARHPLPSWYGGGKLGIFVHWGVYSVPSWAPVGEYAEWYWSFMNDPAHPVHEHHRQTYGTGFGYDDFIPQFRPSRFNAREWVELIRDSGARYFVFTAKHHDGFAMYDSSTTNRDSAALGPQRDFVSELFLAAKIHTPELKRGLYYSLFEWFHPARTNLPPTNPYTGAPIPYTGAPPVVDFVVDHVVPQVRELIDGYDPDIVWCDGEARERAEYWRTAPIIAHYFNQAKNREQPKEVVVNDRCSVTNPTRSGYGADFATIEYDTFSVTVQKKWEMTRGLDPRSFGFNSKTPRDEYLTATEAIHLLVDVVSKNGNLLLNIGPAADGSIPAVMRDALLEIGMWLRTNGEAIYNTTYWWRTSEEGNFRFTVRGSEAFYVIALTWPGERLVINSPIPIRPGYRVELLGDNGRALQWALQGGALVVELPPDAKPASRHAWAFRFSPGGRSTNP